MILSMTGFGKATGQYGNKKLIIEIKSLNSKQTDLTVRMPNIYKEKEMEMRNLLYTKLERGKIEFNLFVENNGAETAYSLNTSLIKSYFESLEKISGELNHSNGNLLELAMRLPDVVRTEREEVEDEEWKNIQKLALEACKKLTDFRAQEGDKLKIEFESYIQHILENFAIVEANEKHRIDGVRARLEKHLADVVKEENLDKGRLEQELIYYLEKLDITEERVRLKAHCDYFIETLNHKQSQGKKLGFITQEIGREINTIGSKAYHADIQRAVVQMKDELEKIKEQVLNVL